LAKGV
jgi:hypothetical protein